MTEEDKVAVSAATLDRLKAELNDLKTRGRQQIGERLNKARQHGDVKENADLDAVRDEQGLMEARIRFLEQTVGNAEVREHPAGNDAAMPGTIVVIRPIGEEETEEYFLASSAEDRIEGVRTVTESSPLGSSLVGAKVGAEIEVEAPAGKFKIEIVAIRPA